MDINLPRQDLAPLGRWERYGLLGFFALLVGFGVIVEIRSVFLSNRQTDLGVFLRAAWATRVGDNPYSVCDDNGWHFCYPSVVGLLLTPLADAPQGADRLWMLPWSVEVVLWYLLSLACLFLAVHWIAGTLEARSGDPAIRTMAAGCRRWWFDRVFPILLCVIQIGGTLSRGQVNFIIILCVAGAFVSVVKGQRLRHGLWLATAICFKVIPVYLLLFPLWRRDGRALVGVALGLAVGLVVIPSLYWGIPEAWNLNEQLVSAVLLPGLQKGGDQTRAEELTNITATDNQSFQAILHNYQYWGRLQSRPARPADWTRNTHWILSAALTLAVLLAAGPRRDDDPVRCLLFLGSLFLVMTLITPVSHLHYFSMAVPLLIGLVTLSLQRRPGTLLPRPALVMLFLVTALGYALPSIPLWEGRREAGFPLLVSMVLLVVSMGYLRLKRRTPRPVISISSVPCQGPSITGTAA